MKNNKKQFPETPTASILDNLLPRPIEVMTTGIDYVLSRDSVVKCFEEGRRAFAAEHLVSMVADEWEIRLPVQRNGIGKGYILCITNEADNELLPPCPFKLVGQLGEEGYHIEVNERGVRLKADTPRGLLWGAMTVRQLIAGYNGDVRICGSRITDHPRYAWRGFQIDSGRSPNSIRKIKRIIRICSAFKLNLLVFREGDDEMNAVRYKSNPLGSENPYALSLDDLAELSNYAMDYGITLVPEVESLGHSTAKGVHYPDIVSGGFETVYGSLCAHIRKSHLNPCDPRSLKLLGSIYTDLISHLHPPMIHMGMDEVRLPKETQAQHFKAVLDVLFRKTDMKLPVMSALVWSDCPPTPFEYQGRVIRCLWEYGDGRKIGFENEALNRQGIAALSDAACCEQVFMAGGSGAGHTPYSKTGYEKAFHNLASWAKWGASRGNFVGLFAVQWSGNMTDEWLPDFICAADFGWRPPDVILDFAHQYQRVQQHLSRLSDAISPKVDEVDRPAWDGIWLKGRNWDEDILATACK